MTKSKENFNLQIISDIHLEFRGNRNFQITPKADNIALCGDIGRPSTDVYKKFIDDLSKKFKRVFIIAGNHEFYGGKKKKTISEIKKLLQIIDDTYDNVWFLDNRKIVIDGVRILGATLWSYVSFEDRFNIQEIMNDYRCIYKERVVLNSGKRKGLSITPDDTVSYHKQTVEWLKKELRVKCNLPTIILTHHAPYTIKTIHDKYKYDITRFAYCTDLSDMFTISKNLKAWCFGHTHYPYDEIIDGVRLVNNPEGYPKETEISHTNKIVVVDSNTMSKTEEYLCKCHSTPLELCKANLCKCHSIPFKLCKEFGSNLKSRVCSGCLKNKAEGLFVVEDTNLGGFVWNTSKCHECNTNDQYDLIESIVNYIR